MLYFGAHEVDATVVGIRGVCAHDVGACNVGAPVVGAYGVGTFDTGAHAFGVHGVGAHNVCVQDHKSYTNMHVRAFNTQAHF